MASRFENRTVSSYSVPVVVWTLVISLCAFSRFLASERMEIGFRMVTGKLTRNIRLIEFLDQNAAFVLAYVAFCMAVATFCVARRVPEWCACLVFLSLVAPCVLYFKVCSYVGLILWAL